MSWMCSLSGVGRSRALNGQCDIVLIAFAVGDVAHHIIVANQLSC
jgi:hypothetical protein